MSDSRASNRWAVEYLQIDSDTLLSVLNRAKQLLDWEGESIVPEGPGVALIDYMAGRRTSASPYVLALLQTLRRVYGAGVARSRRQVDRYAQAVERFAECFGPGNLLLGRAPARINIFGEHVDYVKYLPTEVLPFASREHDMLILFRPTEERVVRGRTTLEGCEPATFALPDGPEGTPPPEEDLEAQWLSYLREVGTPEKHWINYVKASVYFCAMRRGRLERGFDFLLDSTIPAAAGPRGYGPTAPSSPRPEGAATRARSTRWARPSRGRRPATGGPSGISTWKGRWWPSTSCARSCAQS